jgi:hypothetical protein
MGHLFRPGKEIPLSPVLSALVAHSIKLEQSISLNESKIRNAFRIFIQPRFTSFAHRTGQMAEMGRRRKELRLLPAGQRRVRRLGRAGVVVAIGRLDILIDAPERNSQKVLAGLYVRVEIDLRTARRTCCKHVIEPA